MFSGPVVSDSVQPHGLEPARLLCPWDFPGKNTGVEYHSLLQGIIPTQGSNLGLQHCRRILYHLSGLGSLGLVEGQSPNMGEGCLLFYYNQPLPHLAGTMPLWLYYCCYTC